MRYHVTQGDGACPEPVEGPAQKRAIGSAIGLEDRGIEQSAPRKAFFSCSFATLSALCAVPSNQVLL